jgi:hypothetical protein
MPAGGDQLRPVPEAGNGPTFTVEHFGWGAPDRLEVAGTFTGLQTEPPADPVLTVYGEDGAYRLPAIDDDAGQVDGAHLTASFAWVEEPVAFDRARLELGGSLAIDLLGPGTPADGEALPVELLGPAPARSAPGVEDAAERLRLETMLIEAAEHLEEARATAREAEAARERAEADLAAERERRAADAERFREGLATLRRSAEEALETARDEITALRGQIAELEPASAERDEARAELAGAQEELDAAHEALAAVREQAQALLGRASDAMAGRR